MLDKRYPLKTERFTVTATPATLVSLIAGAAFNTGTNAIVLVNADSSGMLYWGVGTPSAITEMIPIPPGQAFPLPYDQDGLALIYVAGDGSQSAALVQDVVRPRPTI